MDDQLHIVLVLLIVHSFQSSVEVLSRSDRTVFGGSALGHTAGKGLEIVRQTTSQATRHLHTSIITSGSIPKKSGME